MALSILGLNQSLNQQTLPSIHYVFTFKIFHFGFELISPLNETILRLFFFSVSNELSEEK